MAPACPRFCPVPHASAVPGNGRPHMATTALALATGNTITVAFTCGFYGNAIARPTATEPSGNAWHRPVDQRIGYLFEAPDLPVCVASATIWQLSAVSRWTMTRGEILVAVAVSKTCVGR